MEVRKYTEMKIRNEPCRLHPEERRRGGRGGGEA
jgi:hypothetical protein